MDLFNLVSKIAQMNSAFPQSKKIRKCESVHNFVIPIGKNCELTHIFIEISHSSAPKGVCYSLQILSGGVEEYRCATSPLGF